MQNCFALYIDARRLPPTRPISRGSLYGAERSRKHRDCKVAMPPNMAQPALNGTTRPDPADETSERVWATLPKSLVTKIDDFHHGNRLRNRSAAVALLIELGLETDWRKKANA